MNFKGLLKLSLLSSLCTSAYSTSALAQNSLITSQYETAVKSFPLRSEAKADLNIGGKRLSPQNPLINPLINPMIFEKKRELTPPQQQYIQQLKMMTQGPGGTGGGDEFVVDFVSTALQDVYPLIDDSWSKQFPSLNSEKFLKAIDPKIVSSANRVFESCEEGSTVGREVAVCFNRDRNQFIISRSRYPINAPSQAKTKLVAHEIFRKMGLEGDNYEITSRLIMPSGFVINGKSLIQTAPALTPSPQLVQQLDEIKRRQSQANSAYSQLAGMLRSAAIDRATLGHQTLKEINTMIAEWVKKAQQDATRNANSKGIIELDLGLAQSQQGHQILDLWHDEQGRSSENNSSYQEAYLKAINASLSSTGLGVLSIGTKQRNSQFNDNQPTLSYGGASGAISAYAFIGPLPGAEVRLADYAFKVMNFAQGLETMGRIYSEALAKIEMDFQEELAQKGIHLSATEYMAQVNELFKKADLKFSVTMFQDQEAQNAFLAELQKTLKEVDAHQKKSKKAVDDMLAPQTNKKR